MTGYILLCILSVKQFKHVADFINWDRVLEAAEPTQGFEALPPAHSYPSPGEKPDDQG